MSTKTLRSRVALATVVALGAGVLSLVSTSAASASNNVAAGAATSVAAVEGVLNIGTAPSTTGGAVASATLGSNTSLGLINVSSIASDLAAGTTQTATLLSTGSINVYTSAKTSGTSSTIYVTGGYITNSATGANTSLPAVLNGAATAFSLAGTGVDTLTAVTVRPNTGVSSFTIQLYTAASTTAAAANASPTSGTLKGQITVTVAATSVAGTVSTAKSGVWYTSAQQTTTAYTADQTDASQPTLPTSGTSGYGQQQFAQVRVVDAYGSAITSTTGLLQASATNGALVSLVASNAAASTPTQATAFLTGSAPDAAGLAVKNPTVAPLTTVVTISYNGTVVGTKSFTFTGNVAKITLSSPSNGALSSTGTATIAFADAAGNAVYPAATASAGSGSTLYPSTSLLTDGNTTNSYVTAGSMRVAPTSSVAGVWDYTCGASAGSASVAVKYTNIDGTVITSNALTVTCSGSAFSYTAALDKSSYAPGDIAILKVTFKDSKGNVASDASAVATSLPTVSGSNLTGVTGTAATAATTSDTLTNGVATYKFVVAAPTIDPFSGQLLVSFPTVNALNSAQSTQTLAYSIKSGSTSLNDVLKGIVSLIASINKQIAALAKLVTKK
jgi:hypothetical protein